MRRVMTSAAIMLGMALLTLFSYGQVRGTPVSEGQQHTSRSATVPVSPRPHQGVMPIPIGVSPAPAPAFPTPTPIGVPPLLPLPGTNNTAGNGFHHHHHHDGFVGGAYPVYVPVPVVVDPDSMYQASPDQADQETDDPPAVQGPTVFERRIPGDVTATDGFVAAPSAEESAPAAPEASPAQPDAVSSQPAQPQEPSLLVFRDGHQLEVQNYAIVGDMLYDFTPGHARKVPLSQLDLPATVKANDDRGVDFTLPASAKSGQ